MKETYTLSVSNSEKLAFVSNLSTMINSGITILHAIDSLSAGKKGKMKKVLDVIRADLLSGKNLYVSFAKFPRIFNNVTISMIRASEEAGTLTTTLKDIREQLKKDIEFNSKVKSALIYPVLVFIVFLAVLLMILIVVMPKIAQVFSQLRVPMPLPTKIMIGVSNLLLHETWLVLLILTGVGSLAALIYHSKREWILARFYSLPIVSGLVSDIDMMRFSRCMHLLLSSGLTITHALELSEDVVLKKKTAKAIGFAQQTVLTGKTVSAALKHYPRIFPEMMVTLTETGEATGTFDKSMLDISEYYNDQISEKLKTLVTVLEPIMLIVVGLMVGMMIVSFIGPMYSLIGNISPR